MAVIFLAQPSGVAPGLEKLPREPLRCNVHLQRHESISSPRKMKHKATGGEHIS